MFNFIGLLLGGKQIRKMRSEDKELDKFTSKLAVLIVSLATMFSFLSLRLLETGHTALGAIIRYGGILMSAFIVVAFINKSGKKNDSKRHSKNGKEDIK